MSSCPQIFYWSPQCYVVTRGYLINDLQDHDPDSMSILLLILPRVIFRSNLVRIIPLSQTFPYHRTALLWWCREKFSKNRLLVKQELYIISSHCCDLVNMWNHWKPGHCDAKFVFTSDTGGHHNNNLQCHQWQQSWHHDDAGFQWSCPSHCDWLEPNLQTALPDWLDFLVACHPHLKSVCLAGHVRPSV